MATCKNFSYIGKCNLIFSYLSVSNLSHL